MFVYNNSSPFGAVPDTDALVYLISKHDGGFVNFNDRILLNIAADNLPPSTFTSDAIPSPTALQSGLHFGLAVAPAGYGCDIETDFCAAFILSGTARAVESPAPVPEPGTWIFVASGLAVLARRHRRFLQPRLMTHVVHQSNAGLAGKML